MLFTEESRGGAMKGMLLPVPPKGLNHMRYLRRRRRPKIENPSRLSWWSQIPGHQFFS
ncbi:hypothetical protein [Pseudomonas zeae]|uniref:hypothetical protein n=1 Tax=Pseudomonas zeae TaxID=2745510 RepID=UPI00352E898B